MASKGTYSLEAGCLATREEPVCLAICLAQHLEVTCFGRGQWWAIACGTAFWWPEDDLTKEFSGFFVMLLQVWSKKFVFVLSCSFLVHMHQHSERVWDDVIPTLEGSL